MNTGSLDVMVSRPHGIELVIQAMEKFPDKYELQLAAVNSLLQLASGNSAEACCMYIQNSSGIVTILDALKVFSNDTHLQLKVLQCIYSISCCEDTVYAIGAEKIAKISIGEMMKAKGCISVLQTGLLILANICTDESAAWHVANSEDINGVFDVCAEIKEKAELLEAACRLTGALAFQNRICEILPKSRCLAIIFAAFDLCEENKELAESAVWASACITKSGEGKDDFVNKGGLEKLTWIMRQFCKEPSIQEYGCWTLSNISESETSYTRLKVASSDTTDLLLCAMAWFSNNQEIHEQAIFALAQILREQETHIHLYQKEGIRTITSSMRDFMDNAEIQEQAFRVLGNLALTEIVRPAVAQDGGISAIISAMNNYPESEQLLEYGCHALANLAAEVAENKALIAEEEGIMTILHSMKRHQENILIQISGCRALCNLAGNELISLKIIQDDGLALLFSTMMNFFQDEVLQELGFSTAVLIAGATENEKETLCNEETIKAIQQMLRHKDATARHIMICCRFIHIYSYEENNHNMFITKNMVGDIINAMKKYKGIQPIQEYGCKSLALISYGEGKDCVVKENGIDLIFGAMERYQDNLQLQLVCSGIISSLAKEDMDKSRVDNNAWVKVLLRNMSKFSDNKDMQVVGCITMPGLVSNDNQKYITEENGFIDLIIRAIERFEANTDVLIYSFNTLISLITTDHFRNVARIKFVDKLVINAMKQFPKLAELQLTGCQTLEKIYKCDSKEWYEAPDDAIEVLEDTLRYYQVSESPYKVAVRLLQKIKGVPI